MRLKKIQEMEHPKALKEDKTSDIEIVGSIYENTISSSDEDPISSPEIIIINVVPSENTGPTYETVLLKSAEQDIETNSSNIAIITSSDSAIITSSDSAITSSEQKEPKKFCKDALLRILLAILMLVICSPFIICNFFFATTDVSCINENSGLGLPFRTLLIVDASLVIIYIFLLVIIYNELYTACSTVIYNLFNFVWLIIECIIFFSFMNGGRLCNHSVYTYIITILILKIIGQGILVLKFIFGSNKQY